MRSKMATAFVAPDASPAMTSEVLSATDLRPRVHTSEQLRDAGLGHAELAGDPGVAVALRAIMRRALIAHDLAGDRTVAIFNNTDMAQGVIGELAEALIAAG